MMMRGGDIKSIKIEAGNVVSELGVMGYMWCD